VLRTIERWLGIALAQCLHGQPRMRLKILTARGATDMLLSHSHDTVRKGKAYQTPQNVPHD